MLAQILLGQLLLGLINGAFYAMLSLGLSVIFGMLNIINFVHGALFMLGAFIAFFLGSSMGVSYWLALLIAPLIIGVGAVVIEQTMLRRLYPLDHVYGWLLTFGLSLMIESGLRRIYGSSGKRYEAPEALQGGFDVGLLFVPNYRLWVVVVSMLTCFSVWYGIERTKLGSYLRASTENPTIVQAFGINVNILRAITYGGGAALAGLAGVLAAPVFQVSPTMGSNIIVILFAVVVIGGLGSLVGTVVTGLGIGVIEALTKTFYPQGGFVVVFVLMALTLTVKPGGIFGRQG